MHHYYRTLRIRPGATQDEIKRAFRRRAFETHPDRNPHKPRATELFQAVQEAYEMLRDRVEFYAGEQSCEFPGCSRVPYAIGYCRSHYMQWHRGEDLREIRKYARKGCTNCGARKHYAKGKCRKCYTKQQRKANKR